MTGKRGVTAIVPILPAVAAAVARYAASARGRWARMRCCSSARGGPLNTGVVRASVRQARRGA